MIDIHCHILPGIDDGASDLETALKMAGIAARDGIKTIVATPHCYDGVHECQEHDIVALCRELNIAIGEKKIDLTVLPGAEVRLTPELIECVHRGELLTFGGSENYLLLELPEIFIPEAVFRVVGQLHRLGIRCVIAHPERNTFILGQKQILNGLVFAGADFQLTAGSLTGLFGRESKMLAQLILKMPCNCYLASDAHDASKRKPIFKKALKYASVVVGKNRVAQMVSLKMDNNGCPQREVEYS